MTLGRFARRTFSRYRFLRLESVDRWVYDRLGFMTWRWGDLW